MKMRFGAHMSVAGGIDKAIDRAVDAGCDCLQVFTKSSRQWAARPLSDEEVATFRRRRDEAALAPVVAHASYLINLASSDSELWKRSWRACAEELRRCALLGLDALILHPGAHGGVGEQRGLSRIARATSHALHRLAAGPRLLFEGTAGQGTSIGGKLEHLRWLVDRLGPERVGVCLDTCHLHAAGYSLGSRAACRATLERIDAVIGFDNVEVLHCNDSVGAVGSHLDRHAHIASGKIGAAGFRALLTDPRIKPLPGILETAKDDVGEWDRRNLARLRALGAGKRRLPPAPPAARFDRQAGKPAAARRGRQRAA